jgi:hypothetical protein
MQNISVDEWFISPHHESTIRFEDVLHPSLADIMSLIVAQEMTVESVKFDTCFIAVNSHPSQ